MMTFKVNDIDGMQEAISKLFELVENATDEKEISLVPQTAKIKVEEVLRNVSLDLTACGANEAHEFASDFAEFKTLARKLLVMQTKFGKLMQKYG